MSGGTAPETLEPELRRVTVLFADIQGSTALIHDLDAEDAAGLIDPALTAMIEAAERFDGAVSHRGDGIMAVFGAPTVAEDHALRACLAALAMRDAVGRANDGVRLRIGIHAGEVVYRQVRIGGVPMHDAVGIAVHIAARLEQSAEPGTICVSGAALALASSYVSIAPLDPILVKGVDAPIARHRLLAANPFASRWGVRAARGLSPHVGRQAELDALSAALARDGIVAVHLVGPAGMGKSRLIHEFLSMPTAQERQVVTFTGDRLHRLAPFHPVAAWLRGWLDIRDADSPAEAGAKIVQGLAGVGVPTAAEAEVIARLLGLGEHTTTPRERIDFGPPVADLLAALAGNRRLLLVCEEADNFDPATLELLEAALPRLAATGVLVVSASRVRVRLPGLPTATARTLTLAPLADDEAAALLAGIDAARAADPALAAEILQKAGGNPLFLEEVAPLVFRAGSDAASLPMIPDRVEELIADRLGRLPLDLHRLIQLCAVIGPDVPLRVVAPLSGLDDNALQAALRRMEDEQLLYESRKFPDPRFSFKHALTRDVAYRTILAARRREHHAAIADVLAAGGEAARRRDIDDLCHHSLLARRWRPAVDYLREAARAAQARTAYQAALGALRRARETVAKLDAGPDLPRLRLDVLLELHAVVRRAGNYAEFGELLDEAETLAAELGERARLAELMGLRVHMYNILGRLDEAIALGERNRLMAMAERDGELLMDATHYAGQSYYNAGRLDDAERRLDESLAAADAAVGIAAARVDVFRALAHGTRAMARSLRGAFDSAVADAAAAAVAAERAASPYHVIFANGSAGFVACERRDATAAVAFFQDALDRSDAAGIVQLHPPMLAGLGHARLMQGATEAASTTLSRAHRLAKAEQRWMFQLFAATGMALAGLALGEPDLARGFAEEAVGLADRYGFKAFRVRALRVHGTVLAATAGREAEGHAGLWASIAAAETLGMAPDEARGRAALAAVGAPGAATHLADARARHAALGLTAHFATVEAAIAAGRLPYL